MVKLAANGWVKAPAVALPLYRWIALHDADLKHR